MTRLGLALGFALISGLAVGAGPVATSKENIAATGRVESKFVERLLVARVNGTPMRQPVLVILRGDQVYARPETFERWRLTPPAVSAVDYHGETYLPLDALEGLKYTVDERAQELILTAQPGLFSRSVVSRPGVDDAIPPPAPLGGFFNYDLNYLHREDFERLNGLFEVGVFNNLGVLTSSFLGDTSEFGERFVRLETTFTHDMPGNMTSFRIGDSINRAGAWGRSVRFGGFQWATKFETRPGFIPFPLPSVKGKAVLPSTVDLYVDNAQRLSKDVPPGPFTIPNVPLVTGSGEAQVVVTDILGRERVITLPYYVSQGLLSEGLSEYSYEIGAVREDFGFESSQYGDVFAAGTHRYGFTDTFTGEARVEVLKDQQTVGLSGSFLWSTFGTFTLTAAGSRDDGEEGGLIGFGMERQAGNLSFGFRTEITSENFAQLGQSDVLPPPRRSTFAWAGFSAGDFGHFSFNYTHLDRRNFADAEFVVAGYSTSLWDNVFLSVFGLKDLGSTGDDSISAVLTIPFGGRSTASATYFAQNGNQRYGVQLQHSLPAGSGFGYRLSAEQGDNARDQATLLAQSSFGTYRAQAASFKDKFAYRLGATGGVAVLDSRFFPTRWIDDSFGVVKASDYENVTVYAANQAVATTGEAGYALIPNLRAYQDNSISIEPADLPLSAQVGALELEATPWFRSGVLIDFPVNSTHAALLEIVLEHGNVAPAGAHVELMSTGERFPVALRGEAYITGLQEQNTVRVHWLGQTCRIEFSVPESAGPLPKLGPFVCQGVTRDPEAK